MDDDKEKQAEPSAVKGAMIAPEHKEEQNLDVKEQQFAPMQEGVAEKPRSGQKSDFHTSFWPTLLFIIMSFFMGAYSIILMILISMGVIILRIALAEKNYYLAKGFLWGALVGIGIPLSLFLLMAGTCIIFGGYR